MFPASQLNPDLTGDTALVLGHGNVALDVARMLLTPIDILKVKSHYIEVKINVFIFYVNVCSYLHCTFDWCVLKENRHMSACIGSTIRKQHLSRSTRWT